MNNKKELLLNTVIIAIGKLSTQIISVILLPLYTLALSSEEYGIYDLIVTVTTFLAPAITILMEESMFRFLIDCDNEESKNKVISQTFIYTLISSFIYSVIIILIGKIFNIEYIWIILLFIISNIILSLKNSILRGMGKIKTFAISNAISSLILIICNIIFIVVYKVGYVGLLYSGIISNILVSILILLKLKIYKYVSIKKIDKSLMKEMIKYSIPLVPNSISWTIINLSDRIMISSYIGTAQNGIYSMAYKFPNFMDTIYGFFYTAWKESASKALKQKDSSEFYNYVYVNLKKFMTAIVLGMIAFMPIIFPILIKGEFTQAYLYIPILIVATYYSNISGFFGGIFAAHKVTKIMGSTTVISAVINIIINFIFIRFIGVWAAAVSTLIATSTVYLIRKKELKKYLKMNDHKSIITMVVFIILIITYYMNKLMINVCMAILITIYCIYINKDILKIIINKMKGKFGKNEI